MKVVLVHDDLMQWGGAERVLEAISDLFPEAPIYTSIYNRADPTLAKHFGKRRIVTSFMQKLPFLGLAYKTMLPLYPIAFEQFDFSSFELVISQTTRFAKSILTKPEIRHISYIHTPPRFLWGYGGEIKNPLLRPYLNFLRFYDLVSASRVDQWLAGSLNCQDRLKKIYNVSSEVLPPFVDDQFFEDHQSFDGDYYLVISRLNRYKRVDLVVEAFNRLKRRLVVVGRGPEAGRLQRMANSQIEFYCNLADGLLIQLLRGCRGVIIAGEEDFGLVSLEAQAMGKAVLAYRGGGALETVKENQTGLFFDRQSIESIMEGVKAFEAAKFEPTDSRANAMRFTKQHFQDRLKQLVF